MFKKLNMYQKFDAFSEKICLKDEKISSIFYAYCLISIKIVLWHSLCVEFISDGAVYMQSAA
jgi:hypothetical protein